MSEASPGRAVVLLSGGLDSATTLAIAAKQGLELYALTFRYGQRHELEVERAREQARRFGVRQHRVVELDLASLADSALTDRRAPLPADRGEEEIGSGIPSTYVPGRNLVFLAVALSWAESLGAGRVMIGANRIDFSGYPDCRPEFLDAVQACAAQGTRAGAGGSPIRVEAPLIDASKAEIVAMALQHGVDLARTLSCYDPDPDGRPCRRCDACRLRARGFRARNLDDPALQG